MGAAAFFIVTEHFTDLRYWRNSMSLIAKQNSMAQLNVRIGKRTESVMPTICSQEDKLMAKAPLDGVFSSWASYGTDSRAPGTYSIGWSTNGAPWQSLEHGGTVVGRGCPSSMPGVTISPLMCWHHAGLWELTAVAYCSQYWLVVTVLLILFKDSFSRGHQFYKFWI